MNRSLVKGLIVGTIVGTSLTGVTAMAAQGAFGHVSFFANGKKVSTQNSIVYNKTSYIPVPGVLSALRAAGVSASWKGSSFFVGKTQIGNNSAGSSVSSKGTLSITDADYSALQSNTSFVGKMVSLSGQVFETPQVHGNHLVLQVDIAPDGSGDFVDVIVPVSDKIQKGEFVHVTGRVASQLADSIFPQINASTISQTTWGAAFYPAIQTFSPNVSASQNGFSMTVTKVELAKGQVRIYLSAQNHAKSNVSVDDSTSDTLTQGSVQFSQQDSYGLGYPDFQQNIANGTSGQAVLIFNGNVSNSGILTFTVPVSSDNYNQNWNNFVFKINIPASK